MAQNEVHTLWKPYPPHKENGDGDSTIYTRFSRRLNEIMPKRARHPLVSAQQLPALSRVIELVSSGHLTLAEMSLPPFEVSSHNIYIEQIQGRIFQKTL